MLKTSWSVSGVAALLPQQHVRAPTWACRASPGVGFRSRSASLQTHLCTRSPFDVMQYRQQSHAVSVVFKVVPCVASIHHQRLGKIKDTTLDFANRNFTAIVLLGSMAIGLLQPAPGQLAQQWGLGKWATAGIFLLSGFSLQDGDLTKACEAWPSGLLGLASILFLTPMAASLVLRIHLSPKEFVTGLAIFCCAPTTLSSGVTLAQIAGANKALALALTVASNTLGIITMPFFVSVFIGCGLGVSIPARRLLWSLVQTLLLPLLIGKVLREKLDGFADLIDRNRQAVSVLSAISLSSVPWMQISCSRSALLQMTATSLLASVALGIGLHLLFLAGNMLLMRAAALSPGYDKATGRAVILVASQKTLPVSIAVVERLGNQLGDPGLLVLPCISAHLLQIVIDSMLVNYWLQNDAGEHAKIS